MALLFMDSFDHYATADLTEKWTQLSTLPTISPTINSSAGRRSSAALRYSSATNGAGKTARIVLNPAPSGATCVVGFAFTNTGGFSILGSGILNDLNGANSSNAGCPGVFYILAGSTTQVYAALNTTGTISVYRASTTTGVLLGTTSALSSGVTTYIEIKVFINGSTGTVDVRFNGASVLSLTSQNTLNTSAVWTEIGIGHLCASTAGVTWDYDDLYLCDGSGSAPWNTFLGDCRVDPSYPTAEGATIQWTPLSGTDNALMVDETAPDDDTTYNSAASTSLTDTLVVQDAPVVGATIYGVQHCLSMKKSDAGVCTVAPVIRHSGVDNVGSSLSPGTSYAYGLAINQTNPGTSAAWVEADFDAAEFGYKRLT